MIVPFARGELTLKSEEMFVKHLKKCQDCREEFEIYYIVEYGLNEREIKCLPEKYKKYIKDYDFSGLVEEKIKDSEKRTANIRQWEHFMRMCLLFVNICMVLTALVLIIIRYF